MQKKNCLIHHIVLLISINYIYRYAHQSTMHRKPRLRGLIDFLNSEWISVKLNYAGIQTIKAPVKLPSLSVSGAKLALYFSPNKDTSPE